MSRSPSTSPQSAFSAEVAMSQNAPVAFAVLCDCVPSHHSPGFPLWMFPPASWDPDGLNSRKIPVPSF
jgi:hypothetical protein